MTKVLTTRCKPGAVLAILWAVSLLPSASIAQATPAPTRPGPAESLYVQLSSVELDPGRVFRVRDASIDRPSAHFTLDDGTIAFTKDVMGRITGAFFQGDGEVLLPPPYDVERRSMSLFTGMAILEERFSTAYFRFNDNTASELQPGLRAPAQPEEFAAQWNETARRLAQGDAMRLLATFSEMLPSAEGTLGEAKALNPDDHFFHARVQGNTLGVFDVFFDSTAEEQVEAGQSKTGDDGTTYYDVWTSFSPDQDRRSRAPEKKIPETLPEETESRRDPTTVRSYVVDARVKPPSELDAEVTLELDVFRGGSRFLIFELSRFLHVQSVEADGKSVEFIQNPAVEGTRLARSANDLVAVILAERAKKGQRISLRFVYGGDVLADAGKGLLYVGARGTWYPNRGLAMADFDLTFHYPAGWTLLATGKPTPYTAPKEVTSVPQHNSDEQVSRWVSGKPIPLAGFNLGKYVRGAAQAGNITIEAYATGGVERSFPKPAIQAIQIDPNAPVPLPQIPPALLAPDPSPARNATAVAEAAARAVRYYAERFGPFPYSQLALTQLPGQESQGWPGLVFLSSYAFLTQEDRKNLHMPPANQLIEELIPAHEAAHQWWGDLITWDTYRDQWFSEGLANYCSLMMLQETNPAGFRLLLEKYRHDLTEGIKEGNAPRDAGPVTLGARLLSSHFPGGYEAIGYGRAAWLFHMLRTMLQDSAPDAAMKDPKQEPFVRSLRKLRDRYEGKTLSTRELLDVFAEDLPPSLRYEGKASLDWFWHGWVNGTSLPKLELQNVRFSAQPAGTTVTGVIRQENAPDDLVTSVPVYAVVSGKNAVPIGRVFADGPETSFRLQAPVGSRKILLDPNGTILTSN